MILASCFLVIIQKLLINNKLGVKIRIKIFIITIVLCVFFSGLPYVSFASPANKPTGAQERLKEKEEKAKQLKLKMDELREKLQEATQQYQDSYAKYILIKERTQRNKQKLEETSIELDLNQDKLDKRVVGMYKNREDLAVLNILFNFKTFQSLITKIQFMNMISKADVGLVEKTKELKLAVESKQKQLEDEKAKQQKALDEVQIKQNDMKRNLDAQNMLQKLLSEDIIRLRKQATNVDGLELSILFPVNGFHSFINDWGFARSGGRTHKGTDVFAAKGTPLIAVTDGVIGKTSPVEKGLGGITVWLYGNDKMHYYYAHMEKIAPGIVVGTRVKSGQVIGTVGNTGNARTTPPHLHFQINPYGGEPINPYPYLKAADPYK